MAKKPKPTHIHHGVFLFGASCDEPNTEYLKVSEMLTLEQIVTGLNLIFTDDVGTPTQTFPKGTKLTEILGDIFEALPAAGDVFATEQFVEDYVATTKTWEATQWSNTLPAQIAVPNGTAINLFDLVDDTNKTGISATTSGALSITEDPTGDYIQTNWLNINEKLTIRVNISVDQGGTDQFRLILKRKADDSVISVHPIIINSGDVPEEIVTETITTYVNSPTDPFITGGFYIEFANDSGGNADLQNNVNILIFREYQNPIVN